MANCDKRNRNNDCNNKNKSVEFAQENNFEDNKNNRNNKNKRNNDCK